MNTAKGLLEVLTDQILAGGMSVEEARQIVLRREHYRREARSLPNQNHAQRLKEIELEAIREALIRNNGNHSATAEELGISRATLYRKIWKNEVAAAATA